ncbi:hypothetical protein, partial [Brachybacterium sp.]
PEEPSAPPTSSSAVESESNETTEISGVGAETPSSPPPPSPQSGAGHDEGGPVVRLFNAISEDSGSGFGQMRQVLIAALGIGFLTTAGFVGATWHHRASTGKHDTDA